jgi:hypothetical protein
MCFTDHDGNCLWTDVLEIISDYRYDNGEEIVESGGWHRGLNGYILASSQVCAIRNHWLIQEIVLELSQECL